MQTSGTVRNTYVNKLKPGVTRRTVRQHRSVHLIGRNPCFKDETLRKTYLKRYKKQLAKAKQENNKQAINFFRAGVRYWKHKGQKASPHMKEIIKDVSFAIQVAGGKSQLKKKLGLSYNDTYPDYISNGDVHGRDMERITDIHNRVLDYLAELTKPTNQN